MGCLAGADEMRALAMLQQLAAMCDETARTASDDPARITAMLETFEQTLSELAPVLETVGRAPSASLDAIRDAARRASDRHQALLASMSLELERLASAIVGADQASQAVVAYGERESGGARGRFHAEG